MPLSSPTAPLVLDVLLFASLAEACGGPSLSVTLERGATVGRLRQLVLADPRLAPSAAQLRVAVNQAFAADDLGLEPGDEVALIPPVAGG